MDEERKDDHEWRHVDGRSRDELTEHLIDSHPDDNKARSEKAISATSTNTTADTPVVTTPLPRRMVCLIALILYSTTYPQNVLFSFLPFMVEFLNPELDRTELGYRAGVIAAAYSLGQFFSSYGFGILSDRWGRKYCVLIGLAANVGTSLMFGMSVSFEMAVTSRFLAGFLCGNNSLAKTMLSEITDNTNSARAFALVGGMDGLARLTAPGVGGLLSQPNEAFGWDYGLFRAFPFIIPCAISALVNLLTLLLSLCYLNETLPDSIKQANARRNARQSAVMRRSLSAEELVDEARRKESTLWSLFKHRKIMIAVGLNSLLMILAVVINEGLPLWTVNTIEHYGFDFTSAQIGLVFTVIGPLQTLCQLFIFPRVVKRFGYIDTLRYCLVMVGVMSLIMPTNYYLQEYGRAAVWAGLLGTFILLVMHRSSAFTATFVLLNNVCTDSQKAGANGVAMSLASLTGVAAPVIGGSVLAWSITAGHSYPLDFSALWVLMALTAWFAMTVASFLPQSANEKLVQSEDNATKSKQAIAQLQIEIVATNGHDAVTGKQ